MSISYTFVLWMCCLCFEKKKRWEICLQLSQAVADSVLCGCGAEIQFPCWLQTESRSVSGGHCTPSSLVPSSFSKASKGC